MTYVSFVCLLFYASRLRIFRSLTWRRHHCRRRAAKFGLCSDHPAFEQGRIIIVPHLLWDGTSLFAIKYEGPVYIVLDLATKENWLHDYEFDIVINRWEPVHMYVFPLHVLNILDRKYPLETQVCSNTLTAFYFTKKLLETGSISLNQTELEQSTYSLD